MKVGIITLHSVANYGTQLQAFATQEKLKQYFDEVEFIDYRRSNTYGKELLNTFTNGNPIKTIIIKPTLNKWRKVFGNFQKEYLNIGKEVYLDNSDFDKFNDKYDIYFSGSDQVWNTGWNNGIIPPLYLSFVPDNKPKYAYASSFGKTKLEENEIEDCKKYLQRFDKISVREESGLKILSEQIGIDDSIRILDPTLVMDKEFWKKYEPKNKIDGDYILIYNLNRSKEFDDYAKKLAKKTGYKIYRFCTRYDQLLRNGKSLLIPEILDFVTLVDNAKIVLTDSFHATAFSFNMNTEPICIYPQNYSSRLSDFLKLVDSEQRHAVDYNDFDVINRHVDFDKVNSILEKEREKVNKFLEEIVKENS